MPSSRKSPQALSTKSHSFLRQSTDSSPSTTTSPSVPSEVRTSQSNGLSNPRYDEEDDVISDDERTPEEIAAAELRANKRRGYDPNASKRSDSLLKKIFTK